MNNIRLQLVLIGMLLVSLLTACNDHLGLTPDRLRVKSITQELSNKPGTSSVSLFQYDGQSRLSSIITYQMPDSTVGWVDRCLYSYDGQNRLTAMNRSSKTRDLGGKTENEQFLFNYNAAGQVANVAYQNSSVVIPGTFTENLQYTGTGILASSLTRFNAGPELQYEKAINYTFTNSNLTAIEKGSITYRNVRPALVLSPFSFTYDANLNPFYGLYVIPSPGPAYITDITLREAYYGGLNNLFNLSLNNVLSADGVSYQYTYNNTKLPVSRVANKVVSQTGEPYVETLHYAYETY